MYDFEYAFFFYKMAAVKEILIGEPYSAKAYRSAAYALDSYESYAEELYAKGELAAFPHFGKKIYAAFQEINETGSFEELREYEKKYDIADYSILLSRGLSNKLKIKLINCNVRSVFDICELKSDNFSNHEREQILKFKNNFFDVEGEYLLSYAFCLGDEIINHLKKYNVEIEIGYSNKFLKKNEKVDCIDLEIKNSCYLENIQQILENWHRVYNVRKINGIVCGNTYFGLPFKISFINNTPLTFDTFQNFSSLIKGDLHLHTNWSDGIHSIREMAQKAMEYGYEYIGITDHSMSQRISNGLSVNEALDEIKEIRRLNDEMPIHILAGIEVDILKDGSLDYPNTLLEEFDFVIAAIHSNFSTTFASMRERLNTALSNPYVNILAHPTGRLLGYPGSLFGERAPYCSAEEIINICENNNVDAEINCFPERLDLNVIGIQEAVKHNVCLSLGTDSHSLAHMSNIKYGCHLLSLADAPLSNVINTYSYVDLMNHFQSRKNKKRALSPIKTELAHLKKDFFYYFGDNDKITKGKCRVVGIDLTGSETKESGWCLLVGNQAKCKRIAGDEEIIDSVEAVNPALISIDSPLAYPKGRDCAKKNCACSRYGIMRESERFLRHFGVPIYPCLIDSMVKLTTRGMKIANVLRSKGYKVIESYPGVAQDVLNIKRKGKTQTQHEHLLKGLVSFGITGDLTDRPLISHDELDAVTSALVGYFYVNNQYVAMGNDAEDYLIVPRIISDLFNKHIVIGLCGEIGVGKTVTAEFLRFRYGLPYARYSQLISKLYQKTSREDLQKIGAKIARSKDEQRNLTRELIASMKGNPAFVVDGLRHIEDYQVLKEVYGNSFKLIYIECKAGIRYKRLQKKYESDLSKKDFINMINHESEKDIPLLRFSADYVICNNRGYKDLFAVTEDILNKA